MFLVSSLLLINKYNNINIIYNLYIVTVLVFSIFRYSKSDYKLINKKTKFNNVRIQYRKKFNHRNK